MSGALDVLIADGVIDEVLGRLKSGKEADISLVRRGEAVLAAKVYKDRATRSFKNNADYKEGRKVRNSRSQRAMESGSKFGRDAAEQAWKSAEADALYKLAGSGVRVPAPVMFYEGVLLMDVVVDAEGRPAPRLIDVAIAQDAAIGIYADLCAQMIAMLCCDLIHGDLSPYNILAAADGPTIIDFPQVVSAAHSSRAEYFFLRDFDNVVRFMAGFDPALAVHTADGRSIWRAYCSRELTPQFVPPPPPPPRATRGPDRRGRPPHAQQGRGGWSQQGPRGPGGPPRQDSRGPDGPPRQDSRGPNGPPRQDSRGPSQPPPRQDSRGPNGPPRQDSRGPNGPPRQDSRGPNGPPRQDSRGPNGPPRQDSRGPNGPPRQDSRGPSQPPPRQDSRGPSQPPPRQDSRGPNGPPRQDSRGPAQPPPRTSSYAAAPSGWSAPRPSSSGGPSPGKRGGKRRPKRHW